MSKFEHGFSYKGWQTIKHGLQDRIDKHTKMLDNANPNEVSKNNKIVDDLRYEKKLLTEVTDFVDSIKTHYDVKSEAKSNE